MSLGEELNKAKYKIPSEAADKAFAMMNLGDEFRLDFDEYKKFYENLLKKLETQGSKKALTRDFRNMGEKRSRKISMSMKGAAIRAGYRQLQDGTFDRTLGKSWQEILKVDLVKGENAPTNPELWSKAKSKARSKFKVYPSAYANAYASKWYKNQGGGWRKKKKKGKRK